MTSEKEKMGALNKPHCDYEVRPMQLLKVLDF